MSVKEILGKFIDAVVKNDDDSAKTLFSSYSEIRMNTLVNPENAVMESLVSKLKEDVDLGDGISYKGTSIFVNGKRVGNIEFVDEDETGEKNTMQFVGIDGNPIVIPNNDVSELASYIRKTFVKGV